MLTIAEPRALLYFRKSKASSKHQLARSSALALRTSRSPVRNTSASETEKWWGGIPVLVSLSPLLYNYGPLLDASHPVHSVSSAVLQLGTAAGLEVLVQLSTLLSLYCCSLYITAWVFNFFCVYTVAHCGCHALNHNPRTPLLCRFPDPSDSLDRATPWQVLMYVSLSRLSYIHFPHPSSYPLLLYGITAHC